MLKRLTAAALSLAIVFSAFSPSVYALDNVQQPEEEETVTETAVQEETVETVILQDTEEDRQNTDESDQQNADEGEQLQYAEDNVNAKQHTVPSQEIVEDFPDGDQLFGEYVWQQLSGSEISFFGTAAREHLNDAEKALYDSLKPEIEKVADNGGITMFFIDNLAELGLKYRWSNTTLGVESIEEEQIEQVTSEFFAQYDTDRLLTALMYDCPYDLYWFDKTQGIYTSYSIGREGYYTSDGSTVWTHAEVKDFVIAFVVADKYIYEESPDCFEVTYDVSRVKDAVDNVQTIIDRHDGKSNYDKLLAYKNEICSLVTYNHYAADTDGYFSTDIDPWQLIYVFDGDTTTNVVCEGYSKAFQYLCDTTTNIDCYSVSGYTVNLDDTTDEPGAHMWNIVTMEDGKTYLADITNSDADSVGDDGSLFLVGNIAGSWDVGYAFDTAYYTMGYYYGQDTIDLWGEKLAIADSNYQHTAEDTSVYGTAVDGATGAGGLNLLWTIYDSDADGAGDTLVINGSGEMYAKGDTVNHWYPYREYIRRVIIKGARNISVGAFEECYNLEEITIPHTVTEIDFNAFDACTKLENVYYTGTQQQWQEIYINEGNAQLSESQFFYESCTDVHNWADANCYTPRYCTLCGAYKGEKGDHIYTGFETDADGNQTNKCSICGQTEFVPANMVAQGNIGENAKWSITSSGVLYIQGTGAVESYAYNSWSDYASSVKKIVILKGITGLEEYALSNSRTAEEITIPDSVTYIGRYAFRGCTALKQIEIPASVKTIGENAFMQCKNLAEVTLKNGVDTIETGAFAYCTSLKDITLPDSVTLLASMAFSGCTALETATLPAEITTVEPQLFSGCVSLKNIVIPDKVTSIGNAAFSGCTALVQITVPISVTAIGSNAFGGCTSLDTIVYKGSAQQWIDLCIESGTEDYNPNDCTMQFEGDKTGFAPYGDGYMLVFWQDAAGDVTIPTAYGEKAVVYFAATALKGNTAVTGVDVPYGFEAIAAEAFSGCTSLTTVKLPLTVTAVGTDAFKDCTALQAVYYPSQYNWENLVTVSSGNDLLACALIFETQWGYKQYEEYVNIIGKAGDNTNLVIPAYINGVEVNGIENAFADDTTIKTVVVPEGVTGITGNSFAGCTALEEITLPASCVQIDQTAFADIASAVKINVLKGTAAEEFFADKDFENLVVTVKLTGIEISDKRVTLDKTASLPAVTLLPADATDEINIQWTVADTSVAEIITDANGMQQLLGKAEGTTQITATEQNSGYTATATLTVTVIPTDKNYVEPTIDEEYRDEVKVIYDEETLVPTIIIPKTAVADGNLPITLTANAVDENGNPAEGTKFTWKSSDTKVAKVTAEKGATHTATAMVGQNADGITVITATADDLNKTQTTIEIDVRDYTPRLETNSITINSYQECGTQVKLYTAYDALLQDYNPQQIAMFAADAQVINVALEGDDAFYAEYDSENSVVTFRTYDVTEKGTYKLTLTTQTAKGIAQQNVTVKVDNKLPKITAKQAANFELTYKDSTADVAITAADAVITKVEMTETPTFTASEYNGEGITVSYADAENPSNGFVSGKADTKVKFTVWLDGYRTQTEVKSFTIKAKETKISLTPSRKATKFTLLNSDNSPVQFTDKKTKEIIDLNDCTVMLKDTSEGYVILNQQGTDLTITPLLNAEGQFTADGKTSHKASVDIQHNNWVKAVTVTHSISVNTAVPAVKAKSGSITLNSLFDTAAATYVIPSLDNCPAPTEWKVEAQPSSTQTEEIKKFEVTADGWDITAAFADADNLPASGSYKFRLTARIGEIELKAITITVKVETKAPGVKLAKTSIKLNKQIEEDTVIPFNVSEGYEVTSVMVENYSGNLLGEDDIYVAYSADLGGMYVKVKNNGLEKGTYKYVLKPIVKAVDGSRTTDQIKAITLSAAVYGNTPTITVSAKGSIDAVNRDAGITYTVKGGKDFIYSAEEIKTDTFALIGADADKFEISYIGTDAKGSHLVLVKAKADAQLKAKTKHFYSIAVNVEGLEKAVTSKEISVTPKQTSLKLAAKGSTTVYQSYRGTNSFDIYVKTPAGAQIADVKLLDTKTTTVPDGALTYEISQNSDGSWKVSYKVKRASLLKVNKTYKLAFEITPQGNLEGQKLQTFNVTVKVRR